jgi:hypothetical protein
MGWTSPKVLAGLIGGAALLAAFCVVESRVEQPMFHLSLFRNRAFAAGNAASLLASVARGGLQFMLIIWLQGIWLPLHGYDYADTPLWAGIFLLPMTAGFLLAGPLCGWLSDRYGARFFTTGGLVVFSGSFVGLLLLPITFPYWAFALLIMANGMGSGMFSAPNTSAIMSSVPVTHRGAASGMRSTFQNSGMSLSIGIFFSLMIVGLADRMPAALSAGLQAQGVPPPPPRTPRRCRRSPPSSPRSSASTRSARCWAPTRSARSPRTTGRSSPARSSSPTSSPGPSTTACSSSSPPPRPWACSPPPRASCGGAHRGAEAPDLGGLPVHGVFAHALSTRVPRSAARG